MLEYALIELLTLHVIDGRTVYVNPKQIISLARPGDNQSFAKGARCIITLADTKFVSVTESCDEVRGAMSKVQ
jgi:uncharacterized cupin superfamily protein